MIGIYATADAAVRAEAIATPIARAWPDLPIVISNGERLPDLPFIGTGARPAWDDLLLVVCGTADLPAELRAPIAAEVTAATAQQRTCRVLPISTRFEHRSPPAPLHAVKGFPCQAPDGDDGVRLARRVGALLWLALRGGERRIFVSHRQIDGQPLATQVTAYLNDHGYRAWRDEERMEGGEIVQDEIARTIAAAHVLLLLDTPRAWESEWVWREIDMAIAGFVPVVPVVLRPAGYQGPAPDPGFRNAAEFGPHRVPVRLGPDGVCECLSDEALDGLLAALEEQLGRLLRMQRTLADKVEASFLDAGFAWRVCDGQRHLYLGIKADGDFAETRLLSHCSPVSPTLVDAVRAFQKWQPAAGLPEVFNGRLFVYEPPLPRPVLGRLVAEQRFRDDALLRLLSTDQLAQFLRRYQSAPET